MMSIYSTKSWLIVALLTSLMALGCGDDDDRADDSSDDDDNDSQGDDDDDNDDDSSKGCTNDDLREIFALTVDKDLYRFNPDKKTFSLVGKVNCQTGSSDDLAFSMAVSRDVNGYAYILFVDKAVVGCKGIYKISTDDATCLGKTKFQCGDSGFTFFGMAFSTNSATSEEETLFLAEGSQKGTDNATLGTLDLETGSVDVIGGLDIVGIPELTGNAEGEIWGLFTSSRVVSKIDKDSAERTKSFDVADVPENTYAFAGAYWKGSFYLFHMEDKDSTSKVYKVDGETGAMELFMSSTNVQVSGAGVSTCAPIIVR